MAHHFCQRLVFALLLFPIWASGSMLSQADLHTQRQIYGRADHALKKNDRTEYEKLKSQIPHYPLYPYLVYDDLKQKLQNSKSATVSLSLLDKFEKEYPDFPFHSTLRNLWLAEMAKTKNWANFVKGYRKTKSEALECQYHFAQYQVTQNKEHLAKAKPLWLVGYSQDAACNPLFDAWKKNGGITSELLIRRIKLALESKNFSLATQLSKQLASQDRQWVEEWEKLIQNPALLLADKAVDKLKLPAKNKAEIVSRSIREFTKREPVRAAQWWAVHQNDVLFSTTQVNQIKRDIAVTLAQQKSKLAEDWLTNLPKEAVDSVAQEWKIRINIANQNWAKVVQYIEALPQSSQEDQAWQYWLARAKQKLNQTESANLIYQKLASTRSYYGFLASVRLNKPISLQNEPLHIPSDEYAVIFAKPAIQRFEELRKVGKEAIARVEWFRATDKMSEVELNAAAKIAHNMGLHDLAIFTMAKSTHRNDIAIRFPLAHEPEIFNNSNRRELDPAWVFAIARQESAFQTDAISLAGARGLMQLLPSTAKLVAKQYKVPYDSDEDLYRASINIKLGTGYLNNLKSQMFDHLVLATASYNAGPGRIPRWLYDEEMEADRWIENIPYKETREYVKNVMAFTAIYRQQLGFPSAFSSLLKPIPAKKMT
jgi:soluble lytic murein transglycosylase